MLFSPSLPSNNTALRDALYAGHIFKIPAAPAALEIVRNLKMRLEENMGYPLEQAHLYSPAGNLFLMLQKFRAHLLTDPIYKNFIRTLMKENGFQPQGNAFDPLRLRAVLHDGHRNKNAARAYSLGRDTWYANPQCQINWWIALQDATEEQTFSFYPSFFEKKVENSSANFDYARWKEKVGFQNTRGNGEIDYPSAQETPEAERQGFSCRAGEIILFSSAHLHQTNRNASGRSRFSIDFRTVHLDDHAAGKGAPSADNGSRPDALSDYIRTEVS